MIYRVTAESWPIAGKGFAIARETKLSADVVVVTIERADKTGTGEAVPLKRYGHTQQSVISECENFLQAHKDFDRDFLEKNMIAGPARNAIDNALWDLEGLPSFDKKILPTAFTLSGDTPENMATMAKNYVTHRWLKIKAMGDGLDAERVSAIHAAAPHHDLIVDANESLTIENLEKLLPHFQKNNVVLIEQPLPAANDDALKNFASSIPLAADESCHMIDDLEQLRGKYDVVNLKLDKTGGLTHALSMADTAKKMGFKLMIGCMASTSLAVLPACVLAQQADFIDLDGAALLQKDRPKPAFYYESGEIHLL